VSCDGRGANLNVFGLSWGPRADLLLVRDVSFSLQAGDRLAIIGPNGAGKTSLLRCLYRGVAPVAGRIEINGEDIRTLSARAVALRVAVVLQEMPADFPFTVLDVVMMGRIPRRQGLTGWTDEDRAQVRHCLEHLDLAAMANRQFATLSGGEKQRVLVARALAQKPDIIILDEPTNHLDIRHQLEILHLLAGLKLTIVTSLHDINLAGTFATHVALMRDGRMVGFGLPRDVLTPHAISTTFGVTALAHPIEGNAAARFSFSLKTA